jgi:hypothetical protein
MACWWPGASWTAATCALRTKGQQARFLFSDPKRPPQALIGSAGTYVNQPIFKLHGDCYTGAKSRPSARSFSLTFGVAFAASQAVTLALGVCFAFPKTFTHHHALTCHLRVALAFPCADTPIRVIADSRANSTLFTAANAVTLRYSFASS